MNPGVLGVFRFQGDLVSAVRTLHARGYRLTAMSPVPLEELEELLHPEKSVIRPFALSGALIGMAFGFLLAVGTALVFILPTGGRPIIPFPPFLIISYEMTILFGVLATLIGFFVASGLPARRDRPYAAISNVDGFSLLVECEHKEQLQEAESLLKQNGAEELHYPQDVAS